MAEDRIYAKIDLPHTALEHSKMVCIGEGSRTHEAGNVVFVKTDQSTINSYKGKNPHVTDGMIFPPGKTTYLTYEEAKAELLTWRKSDNV
jgi:hypothetical protein